jgi:pyrroline-5-carboxylate reductase
MISLDPKNKIAIIIQITGEARPVIRMIPNAGSYINEGYNPVTIGPNCPDSIRKSFSYLISPLGQMSDVSEEKLEAYAVITAMGPIYIWFQMVEIIRLAENFGFSSDDTTRPVLSITEGAVKS